MMIKNLLFPLTIFVLFILLSAQIYAQSYLPGVSDGSHKHDKDDNHNSSNSAGTQHNPEVVRPNNPAMVNPRDPTGTNSNIPGSSGMPPHSNSPGMPQSGHPNINPPSGH
jgi:hypothetical protein